jgi:uncharacterized membrane protein YvbJ
MIYIPWVDEKLKRRSKQQLCNRCGLYFSKSEAECPKCKGLSNLELETILEKRSKGRLGLGKLMLWSSIAVAIILILAVTVLNIK